MTLQQICEQIACLLQQASDLGAVYDEDAAEQLLDELYGN